MFMETDDTPGNVPGKNGGCIKGFFIAILIIILALLLLVVLAAVLTGPSRKQLERLEAAVSAPAATFMTPKMSGGGTVIEIPDTALTGIISSRITALLTDVGDVEYLGLDIRLDDEFVDLLAGIEGTVPRIGIRRKAVFGLRARIGMNDDGWISVTPESARFGRLPLPTGRILRIIRRKPELELKGIRLGSEGNQFLMDPDIWLSGLIPGITIKSIRAIRESLRVAIAIPSELEESLLNILTAASINKERLVTDLNAVVPAENQALLESVNGLFAAVEEYSAAETIGFDGATASYVDGKVMARQPGNDFVGPVDFGDRLPSGTLVSCGVDSFAELVLPGDHIVKISENSEMTVNETADEGGQNTSLSLLAGKIRVLVSSLRHDEGFRVTAGRAAMAVRGTDFAVSLSGRDKVTLAVLEGQVAVNDEVLVSANQAVSVKKADIGAPEPISPDFLKEINEQLGIRTLPADSAALARGSVVNVAVPHVINAAEIWAALDTDTQWEIQYVIEDYVESNPEITRAVDDFFRVNGLEDRRREFEAMFE